MEVAVNVPTSSNILERLRWKVGLGLVIVAAGFAAQAAPSGAPANEVARSSWGVAAESTDVARSSWGIMADPTEGRPSLVVPSQPTVVAPSSSGVAGEVETMRSSWG
jgi:hypothetical protein